MKMTLDIADPLLREAEQLAARDGTTLRALVEQGLRQVVAERAPRLTAFKLRDDTKRLRNVISEHVEVDVGQEEKLKLALARYERLRSSEAPQSEVEGVWRDLREFYAPAVDKLRLERLRAGKSN